MSNAQNDAYTEILVDWLKGMEEDLNGSEKAEVRRLIETGQLEEAYEALNTLEQIKTAEHDRLASDAGYRESRWVKQDGKS